MSFLISAEFTPSLKANKLPSGKQGNQSCCVETPCLYVCINVRNATGMQLLQANFLWVWHCLHVHCSAVKGEHALRWTPLQRGSGDYDGYVCSNTNTVVSEERNGTLAGGSSTAGEANSAGSDDYHSQSPARTD